MVVCKCFKLVKKTPKCAFVRLYFRKKKRKFLMEFLLFRFILEMIILV
jgi:hypothetical protein